MTTICLLVVLSIVVCAFESGLPFAGTSVFGGLTMREANFIAESVAETGALRSLDMVEVNPMLGPDRNDVERTADMGNAIIAKMLGQRLL